MLRSLLVRAGPRAAPVSRVGARALATEAGPRKTAPTARSGLDMNATVEELHNRTAAEILAEREGGKAGVMRHFTVNFGYARCICFQALCRRHPRWAIVVAPEP